MESFVSVLREYDDLFRYAIAGLTVVPGLSKFLTYGRSVAFFSQLGLPAPRYLVPLVGVVEVAAVGLLLVDTWTRVAALSLLPVMLVAAATAGVTWQNVGVAGAAVVLLVTRSEGFAGDGGPTR